MEHGLLLSTATVAGVHGEEGPNHAMSCHRAKILNRIYPSSLGCVHVWLMLERSYMLTRGSRICVTCRNICATGIKNLDWWKSSLIAWLLRSEALDPLILWEFKGQNYSHASLVSEKVCWLVDISRSEFILVPWLAPKKNVDRILIPVANVSMADVHVTTTWLIPIERIRSGSCVLIPTTSELRKQSTMAHGISCRSASCR